LGSSTGFICGGGCGDGGGDTGMLCGGNCGNLKLNTKDLNKAVALKSLDKAVAIGKQTAVR